jgi:hypothetical protein
LKGFNLDKALGWLDSVALVEVDERVLFALLLVNEAASVCMSGESEEEAREPLFLSPKLVSCKCDPSCDTAPVELAPAR